MNVRRVFSTVFLVSMLMTGPRPAKKNPTSVPLEVDEPTILFVGNPASGAAGSLGPSVSVYRGEPGGNPGFRAGRDLRRADA